MNLQRFVGANVREALQCVRTTLGADAMILSNRPAAEGGVEIVAMPHPAPSGEVPMSSGTGTPAGSRLAGARDGSGSAAAVPPMLPTGAADRPIPDGAPAAAMVATATRATTPDAFRMPAARGIDTAPRSAGGARSAFLAANRPRSGAHDGADEARPIAAAPARPAGETRGRVWGRRLSLAERAALGERVDPVYHEPPVPAKPAPADGESLRVEAIAAELARGTGPHGRPRRAESAVDRARSAVQRRIKDALDRIAEQDPELGGRLRRAIRTGNYCSYRPGR
jgi:flagellar biosynthesis GTPase FlhF